MFREVRLIIYILKANMTDVGLRLARQIQFRVITTPIVIHKVSQSNFFETVREKLYQFSYFIKLG